MEFSPKVKVMGLNSGYLLKSSVFYLEIKTKNLISITLKFPLVKSLLKNPAMFCLYTSSKFSHPYFEFSLRVKVMGSNPGYLLKSFLLYQY